MTHTAPMADSEGKFSKSKPCGNDFKCRKCREPRVSYEEWESNCGGYEDYHYTCGACGFSWWVDGIDS